MKHFFYILFSAVKGFKEDDCLTLSSAIAFAFLLSFIPLITLAAKFFQYIQFFFIETSNVNQLDLFLEELVKVIPFASIDWLKSNISNASTGSSLTFFSIVMLPMTSGIIFHELETAYKKIFKIPQKLKVIRQFFYAFFSIFFLFFIFMANFSWLIISSILASFSNFFQSSIFFSEKLEFLSSTGIQSLEIISIIFLVIFFLLTSKIFLPSSIDLSLKTRLLPAFTFAVLWITARAVFSYYIKNISILNIVYGSVSSIVIILLWVFYSAVTLLFSVEVMHALNTSEQNKKGHGNP